MDIILVFFVLMINPDCLANLTYSACQSSLVGGCYCLIFLQDRLQSQGLLSYLKLSTVYHILYQKLLVFVSSQLLLTGPIVWYYFIIQMLLKSCCRIFNISAGIESIPGDLPFCTIHAYRHGRKESIYHLPYDWVQYKRIRNVHIKKKYHILEKWFMVHRQNNVWCKWRFK